MTESRFIQGFHQINCYFQFHLNTEAQPASETRLSIKQKIMRRTKSPNKYIVSLRDELCKIGLCYGELGRDEASLKVTCQVIKTGCGAPKKCERKNISGLIL